MMKSALVLLAEGAEEMEAVITIDILRRGGVNVTVAGLTGKSAVKCSRDVVIQPDLSLEEALVKGPYDAVVLPGGIKGAENLAQSDMVEKLLQNQEKSGRIIGAICAAPAIVLTAHGIGKNKNVTCYPSLKEKMISVGKYNFVDEKIVIDGELVTSQGPGTSFAFGLALINKLMGVEKADAIGKALLL